jgi:sec-independent protein translocase protein TatB
MFDVSFPELMVIGVVALLVLGPERLPVALRTMGLWLGRLRRSFVTIKAEVEREIGMDEVRRQLHNESIVRDLKRLEHDIRATTSPAPPVASAANRPPREAAVASVPREGADSRNDGTASSQG